MSNTDGERLATVTYLPGVRPASDLVSGSPAVLDGEPASEPGERRLPTFQDFDRDTNGAGMGMAAAWKYNF